MYLRKKIYIYNVICLNGKTKRGILVPYSFSRKNPDSMNDEPRVGWSLLIKNVLKINLIFIKYYQVQKLKGADALIARLNDPLPNHAISPPGSSTDNVGSVIVLITWLLHVGIY
jgi:hypothetical protein